MEINEKELHRLQTNLRELINVVPVLRDYLCNTGQLGARDQVIAAGGHLMLAEAAVGHLSFTAPCGSQISTRSGSK